MTLPHLSAEGYAAWAQAIGTVLAIAVTQRIASRQDRARRAEQRREEERFLEVIQFVVNEAQRSVDYSMKHLAPDKRRITPEAFQRLIGSLVRLPIDQMPSGAMASLLIKLERLLVYFAQRHEMAVEELEETGEVDGLSKAVLDRFASSIRKRCREIKAELLRVRTGR